MALDFWLRPLTLGLAGLDQTKPMSHPDKFPSQPPNLYTDEPVTNQMGLNGRRCTLTNAQGLRLATYWWPASVKPRAIIQLTHGNGAYLMEFLKNQGPGKPLQYKGSWIELLNAAGFSVCGHDMQSCGFSEGLHGLRSYFESFDDVIADAVQMRRSIPEAEVDGFSKDLPVFLLGISLGGCVALSVMRRHADLYRGSILLAPMVSLEKVTQAGFNRYLLPLSRLVSWLFPHWQVAAVHRNPLYPELQQEWDQDPLNFQGNTRARSAAEYIRVTMELVANLSSTRFPWICFHGEDDTLCDPDGSVMLYERSQSDDKELVKMPKMWHVLIKEPGSEKIITRIIDWISQRS